MEQIKARLDIADVIREYLNLKQAGKYFKANCPFHHEKTPSFMINRERQIWHCFGCNEGGDVFSFVERIEHIDFREALKMLAEKAGVELTTSAHAEINRDERARLLTLMETAVNIYHRILTDLPAAHAAREYLERRGVSSEMIKEFKVGFAPSGWDILTQYLLKKGVPVEDCVRAGLTIAKTEGRARFFDRFRGRIMFPITDHQGRAVGFTGRILVETPESGGKYVNTPETPLYHKGSVIYGLAAAKTAIRETGFVVMVEGQMDVIACHQIGMKNVIAVSGTALTVEQLHILKRYTDELRVAFDTDSAGERAAERSVELILPEGFVVKVIEIPAGFAKDADECIQKDAEVWCAAVKDARPFMEHLLGTVIPAEKRAEIQRDPQQKDAAARRLLKFINLIPSAVERDHWLQQIALQLGIASEALRELSKKVNSTAPPTAAATPFLDKQNPMRHLLEERVLAMLQQEFSLFKEAATKLLPEMITDSAYAALYNNWLNQYNAAKDIASPAISDPTLELLFAATYAALNKQEIQVEFRNLLERWRNIYFAEKRALLLAQIKDAESAQNVALTQELMRQFQALLSQQ